MNMACSAIYHDHRCIYTVLSLKKAEENIGYTKETVEYTKETIGYSVYLYTWYIDLYPKGDLDIDLYTMYIQRCRQACRYLSISNDVLCISMYIDGFGQVVRIPDVLLHIFFAYLFAYSAY